MKPRGTSLKFIAYRLLVESLSAKFWNQVMCCISQVFILFVFMELTLFLGFYLKKRVKERKNIYLKYNYRVYGGGNPDAEDGGG